MEKFSRFSLFQKLPKILSNRRGDDDIVDLDIPGDIVEEEIVDADNKDVEDTSDEDSSSDNKGKGKRNNDGVVVVLNDDGEEKRKKTAPTGAAVLAKRGAYLKASSSGKMESKDDAIRKLEVKLQASQTEVEKLQETVKTLEVHLRLTNQKLKITKSEYKEKDEARKKKMEALEETMQNKDTDDSSVMKKMKEAGDKEVVMLYDAFRNLEVSFEESCEGFQTRVLDCSQDVVVLKDRLQTLVCEKGEYEKLVVELEEIGKKKDEEKREVIRQLCLQIDYHRHKWLHLLSHQIKPNPNPNPNPIQ